MAGLGPGGKEIARLGVRILPDTSDFKERAEAALLKIKKKLEKSDVTKIKLRADLDDKKLKRSVLETVRRINAENRALPERIIRFQGEVDVERSALAGIADSNSVDIRPNLDLSEWTRVSEQLRRWAAANELEIRVAPDYAGIEGRLVSARLAWLARMRFVEIIPRLNKLAFLKVATALDPLSGARLARETVDNLWNSIKNLDKALPIIGALGLAFANLTSFVGASVVNVVSLGSSLAQMWPLIGAMPGIVAGFGISFALMYRAFKDMKKVAPQLYKDLAQMGKDFSKIFWKNAANPLNTFWTNVLPELKKGLGSTSSALGKWTGTLFSSMDGVMNGALTRMFANLTKSIEISTTGLDEFARIMRVLGETGTAYLPVLAQWWLEVTQNFANFLEKAEANGSLKRWIDNAIFQMKEFGRAIWEVGTFFSLLADAANRAGGSTMTDFANGMDRINKVMAGPTFQNGLTAFFKATKDGMDQIAKQSGPQLQFFFEMFAFTMTSVLHDAGKAFGTFIGALATGFSSPEFLSGGTKFFSDLAVALDILKPAITGIATVSGILLQVLGEMAVKFAPILVTIFAGFTEILRRATPYIMEIVDLLSGALSQALDAVIPALVDLAVVGIQALATILPVVLPYLVQFIEFLAGIIKNDVTPWIDRLAGAFQNISDGKGFGTLLDTLKPLVPILAAVGGVLAIAVAGPVASFAAGLGSAISMLSGLSPVVMGVVAALIPVADQILPVIKSLLGAIVKIAIALAPLFKFVFGLVRAVLTPLLKVLAPLVTLLGDTLATGISKVMTALQPVMDAIVVVAGFLMKILAPVLGFIIKMVIETLAFGLDGVARVINGIVGIFKGLYNIIAGLIKGLTGGGWGQFLTGLKEFFGGIFNVIIGAIQIFFTVTALGVLRKGFLALKALFTSGGRGIVGAWQGIVSGFKAVIDFVVTVIRGGAKLIGSLFLGLARTNLALMRGFWTGLRAGASAGWNLIKRVLTELKQGFTTVFRGLISVVKIAAKAIWDGFIINIRFASRLALSLVRGIRDGIKNIFSGAGGWLTGAGRRIMDGLRNGINAAWGKVKSLLDWITNKIPDWKGPAEKDSKLLFNAGQLIMGGLVDGLESGYDDVKSSLRGFTKDIGRMAVQPVGLDKSISDLMNKGVTAAMDGETAGPIVKVLNYTVQGGQAMPEDDFFRAAERMRLAGI